MSALPVLMYHAVGSPMPGPLAELSVPPALLADQLAGLRDAGYRLTGLTDALAAPPGERVLALTFDDGYLDFHESALDVLAEAGAGATQYVPTSAIGGTAGWLPGAAGSTPLMNAAQLREVADQGIEVGSHNHVHVPMDVLPRATVIDHVTRSRATLQEITGGPVASFCFPHGYHSRFVRGALRRAGYRNACAIGYRTQPADGDPYAVQRFMARPEHSPDELVRMVREGVPGLVPAVKRAAGPAWRAARLAARRTGRTWT